MIFYIRNKFDYVINTDRFTTLIADFERAVDTAQDELKEKEEIVAAKTEELLQHRVCALPQSQLRSRSIYILGNLRSNRSQISNAY